MGPKVRARTCVVEELFRSKHFSSCLQGDRGFDGLVGSKGTQGEKGERVSN